MAQDHSHSHDHDDGRSHDHGHSHEHGEDCEHCGPKVTTEEDVKDVAVPAWKKRALQKELDPTAAPFGMSWNEEASTSATASAATAKKAKISKPAHDAGHSNEHTHGQEHSQEHDGKDDDCGQSKDHDHEHDHGHSHEHGEDCKHCGPKVTTEADVEDVAVPDWKKRALEKDLDPSAAPFGMSWDVEASASATVSGAGTKKEA